MLNGTRFGLYEHKIVYDGDALVTRYFIVLRDADNHIVAWTDLHKFIKDYRRKIVQPLTSSAKPRFYAVIQLLNFIFNQYHINTLNAITNDMIKEYIVAYGLCRLPGDSSNTHRNHQTVTLHVQYIMDFLELFTKKNKRSKINYSELFANQEFFSRKKKKYLTRKVPTFEIYSNPLSVEKPIFRDIPEKAFQIIMNEIAVNHTNILMLASLSAFAGVRPAEACNVRREDSPLGPGLRFNIIDGEVYDIDIDLTIERNLRSDLISVGRIKKERIQKVYPSFLAVFMEAYQTYNRFLIDAQRPFEKEYGALTNNSKGKAYTYASYYQEFTKAIKACIPTMLQSEDPEIVNYGQLLTENSVGPHILRHWFTVQLLLFGENVAGLMYWRGDSSPESALTYIENKSDIIKKYRAVNDSSFEYMLWRSEKLHNANND